MLAIAEPAATTTDHAVDAGGVAFAFAVPEPTVTHTPRVTVDHAVDAGGVSFAFALPQPSVTHTPRVTVDHAVDAGAVAFAFNLPEPTVTHTPRVTIDHAVDAGAAEWAFALPQPTVTHTPRVTVDHAVDAGSVAWDFAVPEPTVTHTPRIPVDHAVDAGSVAWAFALPQPTVTHTSPLLLLSDFVVPAGRVAVFAALIEIEVDGENVYRPGSGIGSLIDGDLILTPDITINRLRVRSGPRVQFNRSGLGIVSTYLGNNEDGTFHFQDSGGVDAVVVSAIASGDRFNGGANFRDADLVSRVDGLVTGDRLIVAFTLPTVDHAVDAGAVAWSFALPQPSVTHTPAVPTTDHAVDAGGVAWSFALPEPTVTHTPAATIDHAVDAGAVAWAFALPQPTVTHTPAGALTSRLFIADSTGDELWELDPDGADTEGSSRTLPATLTSPTGMTVFNGRLLVADDSGDELWELSPDGADLQGMRLRAFPANLGSPQGMTVFNGRLLVVDSDDELWELDPDGADAQGLKIRDLPSGLTTPQSMTVFNGRLFIADSTGDELWELDPDGADSEGLKIRDLPSGLTSPQGMTVFNGRLFIADLSGDQLWEIDPDGTDTEGEVLRNLPSTITFPISMAALSPTHHAVDAGAVSFAFALPEPTVTHTPRVTDHAVNAGGVAWAFALPRPTVTHTRAPSTFIRSAFSQETDGIWLILLTISHVDLTDDIRVVHNPVAIMSRGANFVGFAFELSLPIDSPDRAPVAELRIDNVSQEIAQAVRSISSAPTVTIEVIQAADPDTVELTLDGFRLRDVNWNADSVRGTLVLDDIATEPYPAGIFSPAGFPGLT